MTRKWLAALVVATAFSLVSCSPSGDGKPEGGMRPAGKPSVVSTAGRFATDPIPGLAVLNPVEELAEFDPKGILRWMPVMGADAYEVWVYQDEALSQVVEFSG